MSSTHTRTHTRTEARVRAVVMDVFETLTGACSWGILDPEVMFRWQEDLLQMLVYGAIVEFEFQFQASSGSQPDRGLRFTVHENGQVVSSSPTGGVDYAQFPQGTQVHVVVRPNPESWRKHLHRFPNWTSKGEFVAGDGVEFSRYSKQGYGVISKKVGAWDD